MKFEELSRLVVNRIENERMK